MKPIDYITSNLPVTDPFRIAAECRENTLLKYCPACKKFYEPNFPSRDKCETPTEKEQWISGICSDKCWDAFLGPEE